MTLFVRKFVPVVVVFAVIVLPQANRATQLESSMTRARLVEGAYVAADAVERSAELNQGVYSPLVANFSKFLPLQMLLMNAITLVRTEPVDGSASSSGAIGYVPISIGGINVGFTLTVFGIDATVGPAGDGTVLWIERLPLPPATE